MGFWSKLGKIASIAAPIVAAPFTGGASLGLAGLSTLGKVGRIAGAAGSAVGAASSAAGNNRLNQQQLAMQANRDNVSGNNAAENALMGRAQQEMLERRAVLIDLARASRAKNPRVSEFNTRGPRQHSDEYMAGLTALEQRGLERLKAAPSYATDKMTPLRTYQPLDIKNLQGATNTRPGAMEQIGQWAGPGLSLYGALVEPTVRPDDDDPDNDPYDIMNDL